MEINSELKKAISSNSKIKNENKKESIFENKDSIFNKSGLFDGVENLDDFKNKFKDVFEDGSISEEELKEFMEGIDRSSQQANQEDIDSFFGALLEDGSLTQEEYESYMSHTEEI